MEAGSGRLLLSRQAAILAEVARRRLRLKSISAGFGPLKADVEIQEGDRTVLHPLFVTLRDRRAILYAPRGRMDQHYIAISVEEVRAKITETLAQLGPDSEAAVWLEKMRVACREFLDAIAGTRNLPDPDPDLEPALHQLRDMVRTVADHVSSVYRLPSAAALVEEMNESDRIAAGVESGEISAEDIRGRVAGVDLGPIPGATESGESTPEDLGGRIIGVDVRPPRPTGGSPLPGEPGQPPPDKA